MSDNTLEAALKVRWCCSSSGAAVMYTLSVGSGVFVLVVGLYSVLHWKKVWPKVFSPRTFLYPTRTPIEK